MKNKVIILITGFIVLVIVSILVISPLFNVKSISDEAIHSAAVKTIIVVIITLLIIVHSLYFYFKAVKRNHELKALHKSKDKLFSVLAHDMRGPLAALISLLKLTTKDRDDSQMSMMLLKEVADLVENNYVLLDNLLNWTRSQMKGIKTKPVKFDIADDSRILIRSLQNFANNKNIDLTNNVESHHVFADRDMYTVVLRNLTMNALKFTAAQGHITVNSELKDNFVIISVQDTGVGMSREVQEKLFNFTETISHKGTCNESGTGLGLVLSADFIKANGGKIWFTTEQGKGSTFYFSVPLVN